jgi:hypothetical protein
MQTATTTTIKEDAIGTVVEKSETVTAGQESSFEISDNAKGGTQVTVKVYNANTLLMIDEGIESYITAKIKVARAQIKIAEEILKLKG